MKFIYAALRIILVVIFVMWIILYFLQEKLIFYPAKLFSDHKFEFDIPFEEKIIKVGDSEVHSLYFAKTEAPGVIVYFHGNAGGLGTWGDLARDYVKKTGWNIWMVDYPGYGKSPGHISSENQLHEVAMAAFTEARRLNPGKKVVLYGRSLGSGLATYIASKEKVDGLILETPYYSLLSLAREKTLWFPSFLLRYQFLSNEYLKDIRVPTLFVHGTQDALIPYQHGERLFNEYQGPKEMTTIVGGHHNDLPETEQLWNSEIKFLNQIKN